MQRFIRLTAPTGKEIWIKASSILTVVPNGSGATISREHTAYAFDVRETPTEVLAKIGEALDG